MEIIFDDALKRLKSALKASNNSEIAKHLQMTPAAFSARKRRNSFPVESLKNLIRREPWLDIDLTFVLTGDLSNFEQINRRFKEATGLTRDFEVANALGVGELFVQAKLDDLFPTNALYSYAQKRIDIDIEQIDIDYIISGKSATVNHYGVELIEMLEKLATLPEEVQLNVAEQVNYLYFLRNKIKSLRTHLRLTESLAEIDNSAKV